MALTHGIDISQFQQKIDWEKVKDSGKVEFVYARATEGLGFIDGSYRSFHDGAKLVGIPFGAYHFFSFRDTGISQAYDFLTTINGYQGQLLPMVDIEQISLHGLDISAACSENSFLHDLHGPRILERSKTGRRRRI